MRLTRLVLADHEPKAQEDAQEYLRMLLDKVQSQMPPENGLKSIFGGILHSQRFCTGCGEHPPKPEAFHDLSLEIGAGATTVSDCLKHYTADEDLDGENQYRCEPCGTLTDARKRLRVHAPPQVLVLHLKRFGFDASTVRSTKLEAHVAFEERLELAPYCTEAYLDSGGASDYELYAAIVHKGTTVRGGHYYNFVKSTGGHWHKCNDAEITGVDVREVLRANAYLLFYKRVEAPTVGAGGAVGASGVGSTTQAWDSETSNGSYGSLARAGTDETTSRRVGVPKAPGKLATPSAFQLGKTPHPAGVIESKAH